jgi:pimeloyl-ACP methyl ester carboxylesterase
MNCTFRLLSLLALALALASPSAGMAAPPAAAFKAQVKYAQVGDVQLAYYTRGKGTPLLMINGFISTMGLWDPALLEELARHHQLILFDNRGVGLSTDTKEDRTTIPQMADDAAGLVKALGFKKVNVLGWSMGARIAQQFLVRHPELVERGVLCSPNPGGSHQDPTSKDVEGRLDDPDVPEMQKVGLAFTDDAAGRAAAKEVLARIEAAARAGTMPDDFKVSRDTTVRRDRARTTLWNDSNANLDALKGVKVPVLVTDGRYDVIDMPRNSLIIAYQIPYAWLAYFHGGHAFLFQDHARFAQVVNAFLK